MTRTVLLCAGGTGGHLFPAEAAAKALIARGWRVELATDHRARGYGAEFPAEAIHIVPSATPSGRGIAGKASAALKLGGGLVRALRLIGRVKPTVAVGFGGYPTVPPILAARMRGVPTIVHDQNAVLGRANRFLASRVTRIATATTALKLSPDLAAKAVLTGNPVRPAVRDAARVPYPALDDGGALRLLVFGGSQGARFLSDVVPEAVSRLRPELRGRLMLVQQCRPEDMDRVDAIYRGLNLEVRLAPFFNNLPALIAESHLVLSRAGASTVSELAVIGRPAIMIPLPGAIDQDQRANAQTLVTAGGGWMLDERTLDGRSLAAELGALLEDPSRLRRAAAASKAAGVDDGAERLADLVEEVARQVSRGKVGGAAASNGAGA
ncbi:MAG: undecaprenyldiphospho-muramoylpentapeptide beta-N-acetylglucosaminyltransferase [Bauldia sp.]|nr:undecaprenyldiphospho-muramoylpentapeptide beta-N-acetylglucosaminyltransferase [Bauldia sp.]